MTSKLHTIPGVGSTFPGPFSGDHPTNVRVRDADHEGSGTVIEWSPTPGGYGPDPNTVTAKSPWPSILTQFEHHLIAALSDTILPGSSELPAPTELGIVWFFDDWLSAPYQGPLADSKQIRPGLERLNTLSMTTYHCDFFHLSGEKRTLIVKELIGDKPGQEFFARFRYLLLGGYFTSDVGMRILGYLGNIPLRRPTELSEETLRLVEFELRKLGL
jgi:hypothetical protein